ncbi:uncharacterized protein LOC121729048 [Aricia agestis]|uniref:uncharacterized protein LOC121729048 n=1 Tax=Aricia agestis TaxID=91739 RepID=UPI001C205456|nr:uncharacterized protein LOC121729048 [Aricia agestis]
MAEYLSRDILEDGLVRSFAPIRVLQTALGSARVDAKYRFVTSPTLGQKVYTAALMLAATVSYVTTVYCYISHFKHHSYLRYLCQIGMSLHYVTHAASIIHSRFLNNESNVRFYVKLQEIDRSMRIDRTSYFHDMLYRINLMNTLLYTVMYFVFSAILFFRNLHLQVFFASGIFLVQFTCTLEWIYFSNLIVHIYSRLSFINMIMSNHLRSISSFHSDNVSEWKILDTRSLRELAQETNDFRTSETDKYLNKIFNLIHNFTGLYRFQVLCISVAGPLRKKATTMLKTIEETPPHFSVYDMWNMDGSTLLNILSIITTLIVTLLQFSLL